MTAKTVHTIDASTFSVSDRQRIAAAAARFASDEELPAEVVSFFAGLLGRLADGREIATIEKDELLTSNEAADLIGLSRPLVNQLLDEGRLAFHTTQGGHRRIRAADVVDYIRQRDELAHRLAEARARGRTPAQEVADELGLSKEEAEVLGIT